MARRPRILLAPLDICDIFGCLHRGFMALGYDAHFVNLGTAAASGLPDNTAFPVRFYHRTFHRFQETRRHGTSWFQRYFATLEFLLAQAILIAWIVWRIDLVILKSGESFLANRRDQRLFRIFGKTVIHAYYGSDERPPYLNAFLGEQYDARALRESVGQKRERVDETGKYADITICNPLSAQFQTGRLCVSQVLGTPIDRSKLEARFGVESRHPKKDGYVRILHAPSMAALKGTDQIRSAVENLRSRGHLIDYVEISGRPNAEVMKEIELCDLVIDELFSDDYGAVLAVEATALGKPVIVCGYGQEELDRLVPREAVVPTSYQRPEELLAAMERLIVDREFREELSRRAQHFAAERIDATSVAGRFLQLAEGRAPDDWFVDTANLRYVQGVVGPEDKVAAGIIKLLDTFGPRALCLEDKPELRERMILFANRFRKQEAA